MGADVRQPGAGDWVRRGAGLLAAAVEGRRPAPGRPYRPPPLPDPEPTGLSRANVAVGDQWGTAYSLRGGTRLTVTVAGATVQLQTDGAQPPAPPQWAGPVRTLQLGVWSLPVRFGYWRFRNAVPGQAAVVTFDGYADPSPAPGAAS
jgi:hypothetical protein